MFFIWKKRIWPRLLHHCHIFLRNLAFASPFCRLIVVKQWKREKDPSFLPKKSHVYWLRSLVTWGSTTPIGSRQRWSLNEPLRYPQLKSCQFEEILLKDQCCQLVEKHSLGDFNFEDSCRDNITPRNKTSHVKQTTRLSVVMEQCLSFFSSSVMKPNKKGIMAEKMFFYKSKLG